MDLPRTNVPFLVQAGRANSGAATFKNHQAAGNNQRTTAGTSACATVLKSFPKVNKSGLDRQESTQILPGNREQTRGFLINEDPLPREIVSNCAAYKERNPP